MLMLILMLMLMLLRKTKTNILLQERMILPQRSVVIMMRLLTTIRIMTILRRIPRMKVHVVVNINHILPTTIITIITTLFIKCSMMIMSII